MRKRINKILEEGSLFLVFPGRSRTRTVLWLLFFPRYMGKSEQGFFISLLCNLLDWIYDTLFSEVGNWTSIEWKDGRLPKAASPLAVGKDDFSCMLLSLLCKGCYKGFNISAAVGNLWPSCLSFKAYICLLKSDYFYFSIYILVVVKLLNHLYFYIEMILK